jgi:hypothetical protein
MKKNASILSTKVIYKEPTSYIGWPTITIRRSGELLVVFSGDREAHVCPWGRTQMVRSNDGGKSWSEPITINNTPLDDRDSGIIETEKGTLLVSWFTSLAFEDPKYVPPEEAEKWRRHAEKIDIKTRKYWFGSWIRRSTDGGASWEEPIKVKVSAPHGPIQLTNGRLIYLGNGEVNGTPTIAAEESLDDGKTWRVIGRVPIERMENLKFCEPHLVEIEDGRLLAMLRTGTRKMEERFLYQTESMDGGRTWSEPHRTPIWGYPPHLLRLKNGWILVTYGRRIYPYGEYACISRDGGNTWEIENEVELCSSMSDDLGYPASVQLQDGSIFTVYYQIDKDGEKPCLMGTHWQLEEMG